MSLIVIAEFILEVLPKKLRLCILVNQIQGVNGRFHTRGRTNRLAFVHPMWIYVVLSSTCSSRRTNRLGKIVFPDGQNFISDDLFIKKFVPPVFTSDKQWRSVCLTTICLSRRFVRPLVWKRLIYTQINHVFSTSFIWNFKDKKLKGKQVTDPNLKIYKNFVKDVELQMDKQRQQKLFIL